MHGIADSDRRNAYAVFMGTRHAIAALTLLACGNAGPQAAEGAKQTVGWWCMPNDSSGGCFRVEFECEGMIAKGVKCTHQSVAFCRGDYCASSAEGCELAGSGCEERR